MESLFPALLPELSAVQRGVFAALDNAPHADLLRAFFSNGKLFRPLLTLVGAGAVGGDPAQAVVVAQAIELLHGASLIHDDIIDHADTRRGRQTIHKTLSRDVALVLGDYLILQAIERLTRLGNDTTTVAAVRLVTQLVSRCCRGQIDELEASGRPIDEDQYVSIVTNKTGALFATSLAGGGLIAGASPNQVEVLTQLGDQLGVIFQIYDDVLDVNGCANALGKPIGNSVEMQRPHIVGVYMAEAYERNSGAPSHAEVAAYVKDHRILERIRTLQNRFLRDAEHTIAKLPSSDITDGLRQLTRHLASWADAEP